MSTLTRWLSGKAPCHAPMVPKRAVASIVMDAPRVDIGLVEHHSGDSKPTRSLNLLIEQEGVQIEAAIKPELATELVSAEQWRRGERD